MLQKLGMYNRVKSSRLYDAYWMVAGPGLIRDRNAEIDFYRKTLVGLTEKSLIFDVGANQGYKTDIFLRLGAHVVAIDPDTSNHEILRQKFLSYRLRKKPVTLVEAALSDREGAATMWVEKPGSAKNTLSSKWATALSVDSTRFGGTLEFSERRQVHTSTLEDLCRIYGEPFYVKIDVEGNELNVLRGMRRSVPYLSFEINLPEFRLEGQQCVELLQSIAPEGEFNYSADCRRGLSLQHWIRAREFAPMLDSVIDPSIEVFWRVRKPVDAEA